MRLGPLAQAWVWPVPSGVHCARSVQDGGGVDMLLLVTLVDQCSDCRPLASKLSTSVGRHRHPNLPQRSKLAISTARPF